MKIVELSNKERAVKEVIDFIRQGKIIVCPTDTVYGLIAKATDEKVVKKVFKIKKRQITKPIPIFVDSIKTAKQLAKINKQQEEFLRKVWPGRVTVVLERKKKKIYGVAKETIALRIPKYKMISLLLKKTKLPLTGTSANISGGPASYKIKEVLKQFKNQKERPDLVVDAGNLKKAKPSTIIDLTKLKPKTLRK